MIKEVPIISFTYGINSIFSRLIINTKYMNNSLFQKMIHGQGNIYTIWLVCQPLLWEIRVTIIVIPSCVTFH